MKRLFLGVSFVACLAVLTSGQVVKHGIPVTFRAAKQVVTGSVLHLEGAVQFATDQHVIRADQVDFEVVSGDVEARGNVRAAKIGLPAAKPPVRIEWMRTNIDGKKAVMTVKPSAPSRAAAK